MIYGLLDLMNTEEPRFCFIDKLATGSGLDRVDAAKPSSGESVASVWPADARFEMSKKLGGMQLPDFISNTWRLLIVHDRVKRVIERINKGPTEFLPVAIYNHKKRVASADYFIINPLGTWDVLDLRASDIERFEGDVVKVRTFALDPKKVRKAPDLFRPNEAPGSYFISKRIAAELRKLDPPNTNRNYLQAFEVEDLP